MKIERVPIFDPVVQMDGMLTEPHKRFQERITNQINKFGQVAFDDSTAATVVELRDDFNALLQVLRDTGVILDS